MAVFLLLTMSFALQKLLNFRRSHLLIVNLSVCATEVVFRKWSPVPMYSTILPTFSSMRFSVTGFMLKSLTQFHWVLLSVFMPIPGCFQYYSSIVEFEIRDCDASRSSFIVQNCFGYAGFFAFSYEVEYCSLEVCEEFWWVLH